MKVQRPGLAVRLALDAYLLRQVAAQLQRYVGARGSLTAVVDEMVGRVFEEVDYVREAHNAERFAQLYAFDAAKGAEHARDYDGGWDGLMDAPPGRRRTGAEEGGVRVPRILWRMTTHQILTMEWMEGVKLTDAVRSSSKAGIPDDALLEDATSSGHASQRRKCSLCGLLIVPSQSSTPGCLRN